MAHSQQRAGAHFGEGRFVKHFHFQTSRRAFLGSAHGKFLRAQIVGGNLHQLAGEIDALGRELAAIGFRRFRAGQKNDLLHGPRLLILVTARPVHAVDGTFGHQPGIRTFGQKNGQRAALGLGGLSHGLAGGGKPMTRHRLGADAQEKEALHGGLGHAMDQRALAGFAGPFAVVAQFAEQSAEAGVQRCVRCGVGCLRHGQRVDVEFLPVSGMDSDFHDASWSGPGSICAMACSRSVAAC